VCVINTCTPVSARCDVQVQEILLRASTTQVWGQDGIVARPGTQWTAIQYVLSGPCASLALHLADTVKYSTGEHDVRMEDKGSVQRCLWGRCNGRKISK
jgi:hypothetical protein